MPYRRRVDKRRRDRFPLDDALGVRLVLQSGGPMGPAPWREPNDDDLREAWEWIGDELVAEEVEREPGSRPWAWWRFDAPVADPAQRDAVEGVEAHDARFRVLLDLGEVDAQERAALVAFAESDDPSYARVLAERRARILRAHRAQPHSNGGS